MSVVLYRYEIFQSRNPTRISDLTSLKSIRLGSTFLFISSTNQLELALVQRKASLEEFKN